MQRSSIFTAAQKTQYMMVYSGGGSHGTPVIHIGPVGMSQNIEDFRDLFVAYGKRFAMQVMSIAGKDN